MARMKKAAFLKNVLEVVSGGLFSKANFEFSRTGLELQAVDTSGFAFVVLKLRSEAFDLCICNNDDLSVGLNLVDMAKALRFVNNDDIVTIEAQDETVVITVNSPDGVISDLYLDFVDVNDLPFAIPEYQEFQYQAIIRMPSAKFTHFCNQLSSFTRDMETADVCISVDKDRVCFFTDGILGSSKLVQLSLTVDKQNATRIEMKEKISLTFVLRYLNSFSKASTLSDQVTIKLSLKLPSVFEYNIAEMGNIRYYVTPAELEA